MAQGSHPLELNTLMANEEGRQFEIGQNSNNLGEKNPLKISKLPLLIVT